MTALRKQIERLHIAVENGLPPERAWRDVRYWTAKPSERMLLKVIQANPGITVAEASRILGKAHNALATDCIGLMKLGLIKRRRVYTDSATYYRYWSEECQVSLEDEY
jgi:predicted transcriptional regulator